MLKKQKVRRKSLGDNEINENLCYHKRVNIFAIFFKHIFTLLKEKKSRCKEFPEHVVRQRNNETFSECRKDHHEIVTVDNEKK